MVVGSQVHLYFGSRQDQAGAKSWSCGVETRKFMWCIKSGEPRGKNKQIMVRVDFENYLKEVGLQVDSKLT